MVIPIPDKGREDIQGLPPRLDGLSQSKHPSKGVVTDELIRSLENQVGQHFTVAPSSDGKTRALDDGGQEQIQHAEMYHICTI